MFRIVSLCALTVSFLLLAMVPNTLAVGAAPSTPTGLAATAGHNQFTATWNTAARATSYSIYGSLTLNGTYTTLSNCVDVTTRTCTPTSFTNGTSITNGTTYFLKIRANNSAGQSVSSTQAVSVTPFGATLTAYGIENGTTTGSVQLTWTCAGCGTNPTYTLKQSSSSTGTPTVGSDTTFTSSTTSTTISPATQGTTYYYAVTVRKGSVTTTPSTWTGAITWDAPQNLTATSGEGLITLTWDTVTAETATRTTYNLQRSTDGVTFTDLATAASPFDDPTVNAGTTYYYRVQATNGEDDKGAFSSIVTATPTLSVPTNLTATAKNDLLYLDWTASPGATAYQVYTSLYPDREFGLHGLWYQDSATPPCNADGLCSASWTPTPGVITYATLRAWDGADNVSDNTSEVHAQVLAQPQDFTATATGLEALLTWSPVSGTDVAYAILKTTYASDGSVAGDIETFTTTEATYTDTTVTAETTYGYRVQATWESNSTGPVTNEVQVTIPAAETRVGENEDLPLIIPDVPTDRIVDASVPVTLDGVAEVTPAGGATYSIPLTNIPAGPVGMQPNLTLTYTGSDNGIIGAGWQLSGLDSMISPCNATTASEGYAAGPSGDRNGPWCLDGKKLVLYGDTDYVQSDPLQLLETIFHTEIESNLRILGHRDDKDDDQFSEFWVHSPDGTVSTYLPLTLHARDETPITGSPIFGYLLDNVVSSDGHTLKVHYAINTEVSDFEHELSYYVSELEYSIPQNDSPDYEFNEGDADDERTTVTGRRRVEFGYDYRSDPQFYYNQGYKIIRDSVLTEITTYAPNPVETEQIGRYALDYAVSPDTGRDLLQSVQYCPSGIRGGEGVCTNLKQFDYAALDATDAYWHEPVSDGVDFDSFSMSWDEFAYNSYMYEDGDPFNSDFPKDWYEPTDVRLVVGDLDSNGTDDILARTRRGNIDLWDTTVDNGPSDGSVIWNYLVYSGVLKVWRSELYDPDDVTTLLSIEDDVSEILEPPFDDCTYWCGNSLGTEDVYHGPEFDEYYSDTRTGIGDTSTFVNLGKSRFVYDPDEGRSRLQVARTDLTVTGWTEVDDGTQYESEWHADQNQDEFASGYSTMPDYPWVDGDLGERESTLITGPVLRWTAGDGTLAGTGNSGGALGGYLLHDPRLLVTSTSFQKAYGDADGDGQSDPLDPNINIDITDYLDADWGNPYVSPGSWLYQLTPSSTGETIVTGANWTCGNGNIRVADLDADGKDDYLVANPSRIVNGLIGGYDVIALDDPTAYLGDIPYGGVLVTELDVPSGNCGEEDPDLQVADFNGDGYPDFLYPPHSYGDNTQPVILWNQGNLTVSAPEEFTVTEGDFSRYDATDEELTALMEQPRPYNWEGSRVPWDRATRLADLDHNGIPELLVSRFDFSECEERQDEFWDDYNGNDSEGLHYGCMNDIVAYFFRGDHFEGGIIDRHNDGNFSWAEGITTFQPGDFNGDTVMDYATVRDGRLVVVLTPWRNKVVDQLTQVRDEASDYPLDTFTYQRVASHPTDNTTTGNHTFGDCAWPVYCPESASNVVAMHSHLAGFTTDNQPMYRHWRYTFQGPKVDLTGRGGLGYQQQTIWSVEDGQYIWRAYDSLTYGEITERWDPDSDQPGGQFYPEVGALQQEIVVTLTSPQPDLTFDTTDPETLPNGIAPGLTDGLAEEAQVTWTQYDYERTSSTNGRIIRVQPSDVTTLTTELDVTPSIEDDQATYPDVLLDLAFLPTDTSQIETTTSLAYDDYGYVTSQAVTTAGTGTGDPITHTTTITYDHDPVDWILGLPTWQGVQSAKLEESSPIQVVSVSYEDADHPTHPTTITQQTRASLRRDCGVIICAEDIDTTINSSSLIYDAFGNVVSTTVTDPTDGASRTITQAFDDEGIYPTYMIDPLGYDGVSQIDPARGLLLRSINYLGFATDYTYDSYDRPLLITPTNGMETTFAYTEVSLSGRKGMRADATTSDGSAVYTQHDLLGQTQVSGWDGYADDPTMAAAIEQRQRYNVFNQVSFAGTPQVSVFSSSVGSTVTYDRMGRPIKTATPTGRLSEWLSNPVSADTTVDYHLFHTTVHGPEGETSGAWINNEGQVISSGHLFNGTQYYDGVGTTYTTSGQVETITDANDFVRRYTYDDFGRVITTSDPETGDATLEYNGFGEIIATTDATGRRKTSRYDALGRVTETCDDAPNNMADDWICAPADTTTYTYGTSGNGRRQLIATEAGNGIRHDYTYTTYGQPRTMTQTAGGAVDTMTLRYNSRGELQYVFYPEQDDYQLITEVVSEDGYPTAIHDLSVCAISSAEYPTVEELAQEIRTDSCRQLLLTVDTRNAADQMTSAHYGDDISWSTEYDLNQRLLSLNTGNGTVSESYTYLTNGMMANRTDELTGWQEDFTYDAYQRLETSTTKTCQRDLCDFPKTLTYHYDTGGNLWKTTQRINDNPLTETTPFLAQLSATTPHQFLSSEVDGVTTNFSYDANGNQLTGSGRTITWTPYNQPETITNDATGFLESIQYDAFGTAVIKSNSNATVIDFGRLSTRHETPAGDLTSYVFTVPGETGTAAEVTYIPATDTAPMTTTKRFFLHDQLGSPLAILDDQGDLVESLRFTPFGESQDADGNAFASTETEQSYTGHLADDTGLVDMGGRWYDPKQLRFISADPFMDPSSSQGLNRYSYVRNNPLNLVDPSGFQAAAVMETPAITEEMLRRFTETGDLGVITPEDAPIELSVTASDDQGWLDEGVSGNSGVSPNDPPWDPFEDLHASVKPAGTRQDREGGLMDSLFDALTSLRNPVAFDLNGDGHVTSATDILEIPVDRNTYAYDEGRMAGDLVALGSGFGNPSQIRRGAVILKGGREIGGAVKAGTKTAAGSEKLSAKVAKMEDPDFSMVVGGNKDIFQLAVEREAAMSSRIDLVRFYQAQSHVYSNVPFMSRSDAMRYVWKNSDDFMVSRGLVITEGAVVVGGTGAVIWKIADD